MSKEEYEKFYNELINAEVVTLHEFEKKEIFEGCIPIEIMAKRGIDTLRFGPLKPVRIHRSTNWRKTTCNNSIKAG
jgi:methylenetetrahydrofolate--tRNA-(uracil-5-)-methyltransferase